MSLSRGQQDATAATADVAREEAERRDGHARAAAGQFTTRGVDLEQLRPVHYFWKPWLVHGELNLLVGEESIGKSSLQVWVAAQATRGTLAAELHGRPARVLWVGADEDDWHEVVTPRLYASGADLSRVREFVAVDDGAIFDVVSHIAELGRELRAGEFDLVVFEQLLDVLPNMKNSNDPIEVRRVLRPLRRLLANLRGHGAGHTARQQGSRRSAPAAGAGLDAVRRALALHDADRPPPG
jgi:hypothetical protein